MATRQMEFNGGRAAASDNGHNHPLVAGLGWFSIGLGLAELAAPDKVANLIGLRDEDRRRTILRAYGLREIAAGVGILAGSKPTGWLWGRVAGDALDLSALGSAFRSNDANRTKLIAATAAVAGVTVADVICAQKLRSQSNGKPADETTSATETLIINRDPQEVYRFWRDFENIPKFLDDLESVRVTGERRSHWELKTPVGKKIRWDAEIISEEPNSRIAWRTLPGSDIDNSGSITFERAPGGRGTLVKVDMQFTPPGGPALAKMTKLIGKHPEQQIYKALHALKQIIETGEIVRSDASIHRGMHAARPPKHYKRQQSTRA